MAARGTPACDERRRRIDNARKILTSKKRTPYKQAIAIISYNLNVSERKAKEYIDTLLQVDGIRREGDLIIRKK